MVRLAGKGEGGNNGGARIPVPTGPGRRVLSGRRPGAGRGPKERTSSPGSCSRRTPFIVTARARDRQILHLLHLLALPGHTVIPVRPNHFVPWNLAPASASCCCRRLWMAKTRWVISSHLLFSS